VIVKHPESCLAYGDFVLTGAHEALHSVFRHDRDLFARVIRRVFDVDAGQPGQVTVLNTDLTELTPLVRRCDSAILAEFLIEELDDRYIVVVESQTDPDESKQWSWPYYIAYLRDRYKCQVVLLVVCSKTTTARWARQVITSGLPDLTCMLVLPLVLGPDNVEPVTDLESARADVGFAVYSALTHSRTPQADAILGVLAEALNDIEFGNAAFLSEFVEAGLAETGSQDIWRALMLKMKGTYPHVSQARALGREEGREEGRDEGRKEGLAAGVIKARIEDILRILTRQGVTVSSDAKKAIEDCTDPDTLETWFDRALAASDIKDVFGE
jgi:hypothetical protein